MSVAEAGVDVPGVPAGVVNSCTGGDADDETPVPVEGVFDVKGVGRKGAKKVSLKLRGLVKQTELAQDLPCTGLGMWAISDLLSDFVCSELDGNMAGQHLLEVGCGLGKLGLVWARLAGRAGGGSVTLTDGDEGVLEYCRGNVAANMGPEDPRCHVAHLRWDNARDEAALLREGCLTTKEHLYDVILGSDVLYEKSGRQAGLLLATAARLLAVGGVMYVSYTRRGMPEEVIDAAARAHGFRVEMVPGYIIDIFGNSTQEETVMWQDCVYKFTRNDEIRPTE